MWMEAFIAGVRFQQRYRQGLDDVGPYDRALLLELLTAAQDGETGERAERLQALLDQLADKA